MNTMFRAYAILNVHPECSDAEIKAHHRALSQKLHPDRAGGDKELFMLVQDAYRLIKGPEARKLLRTRLEGLGRGCTTCDKRGFTRHGKGFNKTHKTACMSCGGCGFVPRDQP